MVYVLVILLVLSLVFNYFSVKLLGEQAIKLNKVNFELFSIKMQLDLERTRQSQEENEPTPSERIVQ
jgi:hypothetical protein